MDLKIIFHTFIELNPFHLIGLPLISFFSLDVLEDIFSILSYYNYTVFLFAN